MPKRLAGRYSCYICGRVLELGDLTLSRPYSSCRYAHYCAKCAIEKNLMSEEEYEELKRRRM